MIPLPRLESWELGGQTFWALVEPPERRRGAGAYLFRVGATDGDAHPAILLEAPHADHDVGTGDISVALFIDPLSFQYLDGTEIDYVEGVHGAGFKFGNPNVSGSCGCGSSFNV